MAGIDFTRDDVVLEKRENLFKGFYRVDKLHLRHRQFSGAVGPLITRELFVRRPAVGVLIYDANTDHVLLIEQFRVGALDNEHPWQFEIVAGLVERGESLEDVARREVLEEAGLEISALEQVMTFMPSPGGSDETFTLFVAQADLSLAGGVFGVPEEGEDIRVNVVSLNQAEMALQRGRINNAACIIALQWLLLHKERLLARWRKQGAL